VSGNVCQIGVYARIGIESDFHTDSLPWCHWKTVLILQRVV
jgi:hypothetical protein